MRSVVAKIAGSLQGEISVEPECLSKPVSVLNASFNLEAVKRQIDETTKAQSGQMKAGVCDGRPACRPPSSADRQQARRIAPDPRSGIAGAKTVVAGDFPVSEPM
jgi:hypothetical protein